MGSAGSCEPRNRVARQAATRAALSIHEADRHARLVRYPNQTGGLADVSAALPAALADHGIDIRLIMPGYPEARDRADHIGSAIPLGELHGENRARLLPTRSPRLRRAALARRLSHAVSQEWRALPGLGRTGLAGQRPPFRCAMPCSSAGRAQRRGACLAAEPNPHERLAHRASVGIVG